jgi:hypothetical protein
MRRDFYTQVRAAADGMFRRYRTYSPAPNALLEPYFYRSKIRVRVMTDLAIPDSPTFTICRTGGEAVQTVLLCHPADLSQANKPYLTQAQFTRAAARITHFSGCRRDSDNASCGNFGLFARLFFNRKAISDILFPV